MENAKELYLTEAEISEIEAKQDSVKSTYRRIQKAYQEIEQGGNMYAQFME